MRLRVYSGLLYKVCRDSFVTKPALARERKSSEVQIPVPPHQHPHPQPRISFVKASMASVKSEECSGNVCFKVIISVGFETHLFTLYFAHILSSHSPQPHCYICYIPLLSTSLSLRSRLSSPSSPFCLYLMHSLSFSLLICLSLYHSLNELKLFTSHKGSTIFLLLSIGGNVHCLPCNGTRLQ